MATKETTEKGGAPAGDTGGKGGAGKGGAGKGGGGKGGGGSKSDAAKRARQAEPKAAHTGVDLPAPPPRLKEHYQNTVRGALSQKFGFKNPHQIPTLEKIVLNVGVGEAIKQPKVLDKVLEELSIITGQMATRRKAKKSIANYGLREGQEIGAAVTLRGARMWEFFDRFVTIAIPRIRDFKGLSTRSFDGRGNYSMGVKEQLIFPEINYDMIDQVHGMDITFVTTAERDDVAFALLKELGMPFRTDEKSKVTPGSAPGAKATPVSTAAVSATA
jgi:large subunit ribosomal protein L5